MTDRVFIIAEAGINHNGNYKTAKKLIYLAKHAGADAVKFQLFNTEKFINKLKYPKIYKRFKRLEFKLSEWNKLKKYSKKIKIKFFFSIFDEQSLLLNKKLNIDLIKIPSGEINNIKLLKKINLEKKEVIVSTGMSNIKEIKKALKTLKNCKINLLHCLSEYPAKIKNLNLNFLNSLKKFSGVDKIGFSDHSDNITLPSVAVSLGSKVIEKHFTHNKNLKLGDHRISLGFIEFKKMCENIRITTMALGLNKKIVTKKEKKLALIARKGLYVIKAVKKGFKIKSSDLGYLRPANSSSAIKNEIKIIGKITKNTIPQFGEIYKNDLT